MRRLLAVTALGLIASAAAAQQSGFQSGDGMSSIYLDSSAAVVNLGDSKLSIGYSNRHSAAKHFFGYEAFGKASSGVTTLFTSGKAKIPEGGADLSFGFHNPFNLSTGATGKLVDDWILLDVGYSRSYFYVSPTPVAISAASRYFDRFRTIAAYNTLVTGNLFVGVAAGAERRNNLGNLQQVTFQTVLVPAPSGSSNSIVKTQTGFYGNYQEYIAAPIYTDILFVLPPKIKIPGFDSQLGIDGFTRSDIASFNRSADGGIGIFLTQKGAPTKVVGGLSASWNDGKVLVAFIAGFNFK